jgi:hypothetical protein
MDDAAGLADELTADTEELATFKAGAASKGADGINGAAGAAELVT